MNGVGGHCLIIERNSCHLECIPHGYQFGFFDGEWHFCSCVFVVVAWCWYVGEERCVFLCGLGEWLWCRVVLGRLMKANEIITFSTRYIICSVSCCLEVEEYGR